MRGRGKGQAHGRGVGRRRKATPSSHTGIYNYTMNKLCVVYTILCIEKFLNSLPTNESTGSDTKEMLVPKERTRVRGRS